MTRRKFLGITLIASSATYAYTAFAADRVGTVYLAQVGGTPNDIIGDAYRLGLMVGGILAFLAIVWGGVRYALAAGDPGKQSDAKDRVVQAFIGLALLAGSYLVLVSINPGIVGGIQGLKEFEGEILSPDEVELPPPGEPDPTIAQRFTDAGISIKSGADVSRLQELAVQEILRVKKACGGCEMVVTSGTDGTHTCHTYATCSHCRGYKVDLRLTGSLDSYIQNNFVAHGQWRDGTLLFRNPDSGAIWAQESDHWDMASC